MHQLDSFLIISNLITGRIGNMGCSSLQVHWASGLGATCISSDFGHHTTCHQFWPSAGKWQKKSMQLFLRSMKASASFQQFYPHGLSKSIYTSSLRAALQLPPRPSVKDDDLEESFLKGSGPGGQKINKTSSAVQLKHLPTGVVVKSQATRSRSQNRKIARRILAEKLEDADKGSESRNALKGEIKRKKKASKMKKARRKYNRAQGDVETIDEGDKGVSAIGQTGDDNEVQPGKV